MELSYRTNSKSLFKKYRSLLTWFSNTDIGRDFLKQDNLFIPHEKIALFLPNGYHVWKDEKTVQAVFTSNACYSSKLNKVLWTLDHLSQWIEDFDEAKRVLLGNLDLISWGRMPSAAKMLRFTSSSYNPDANPETTSVDGSVTRDPADETFSAMHSGTGTSAQDSSATDNMPFLGSGAGSPNWTFNVRGLFLYDTSSIPDTNVVSSATETHHAGATATNTHSQSLSLGSCTPASNTALAASDYQQTVFTRQASDIAFPSANSDFTFTYNSTGIASISITGITKRSLIYSADMDNSAPTWSAGSDQITGVYSDNGSNKPTLTVVYGLPSSGGAGFLLNFV